MTRASLLLSAAALAALMATPALAGTPVPLGPFHSIGLRGGGHIVLKHGATQSVTLLKGSTDYTRFTIEHGGLNIDACNENCPHNYDLEIEIVSPDIDGVAIEGGGAIATEGAFPAQNRLEAAVSGGGSIDLSAIDAGSVDAAVNGGGRILVAASGALNAAVNGGGKISYRGNPAVAQAISGGGSVERTN